MPPGNPTTLRANELEIRLAEGLVLARGHALILSVREFELLAALALRTGAVVTREQLHRSVWSDELPPGNRSVDVYVSKLRRKLQTAVPDRRFIHTHPGFGYRFDPEPALAAPQPTATYPGLRQAARAEHGAATRLSRDVHIGAAHG